jgi:hypothetical protein
LKSCCSSYPPELVRGVVGGWLKKISEVEAMGKQQGNWSPDDSASLAKVSERR